MELKIIVPTYYRVKSGQTLTAVSIAFRVPLPLLARENGLSDEPFAGQILKIPQSFGNAYTVKGGESKTLLCGSPEQFYARNGTSALYPAQTVFV